MRYSEREYHEVKQLSNTCSPENLDAVVIFSFYSLLTGVELFTLVNVFAAGVASPTTRVLRARNIGEHFFGALTC
jgi:hypothetical protein